MADARADDDLPEVELPPGESRDKALAELNEIRERVGDETMRRMLRAISSATKVETKANGTQTVGGEPIEQGATAALKGVERDTDAVSSLLTELLNAAKPAAAKPRPKGLTKAETRAFDSFGSAASRITADMAAKAGNDVRFMRKAYDTAVATMKSALERGTMSKEAFDATKVFFQQEMFGRPKFEGRVSEKPAQAVSAKLELYLRRTLGVKFLHEERSLQTQCTWVNNVNGKEGRDLANELYAARGADALLLTFRVISMPVTSRAGAAVVQCFDVHDLEAHCLKQLKEHAGAAGDAWSTLDDAMASRDLAVASVVSNPSGQTRFFTRAELVYIGRYAAKVRLVERLVRGDDPQLRLTGADVDAMISMAEKLDVVNAEQEAYEHSVMGTVGSYFSYAIGMLSRALEHIVAKFTHLAIIRNVVCIIARVFALMYWMMHLGGDTIEAALEKWVLRYFESGAKAEAIAKAEAGAKLDTSGATPDYTFEGIHVKPGSWYGWNATVDARGKWLLTIVRHVRRNGAKWYLASKGGWVGVLFYVLSSYGSMLAGEALTMVAKLIYNLYAGEAHWAGALAAKLDAFWAHPTVAQIGSFLNSMTGGIIGAIGTATTVIVSKVLRIADRMYTLAPTAVSLGVLGAAGVFFFPSVGAFFVAHAGTALTTAVYYDVWNHCAAVLTTLFDTTVGKLFYDPMNADAASLSTIFTMFSPHLLCEILLPKGTLAERFPYAKEACNAMARVLGIMFKAGAMFAMVLQSMSDLVYIYSVWKTGEEPKTMFGLPWRPSRCLTTWTHTGEKDASGHPTTGREAVHTFINTRGDGGVSERLRTWADDADDPLRALARMDGIGPAPSSFGPGYMKEFLQQYVANESLTDAGLAVVKRAVDPGLNPLAGGKAAARAKRSPRKKRAAAAAKRASPGKMPATMRHFPPNLPAAKPCSPWRSPRAAKSPSHARTSGCRRSPRKGLRRVDYRGM